MEIKDIQKISALLNIDENSLKKCITQNSVFIKNYQKGCTIYSQHEKCKTLDIILNGKLIAYSLAQNGSAVNLFEFKENSIIGANLLFADSNSYPLNIYSVTSCTILHITKSAVEELLHDYNFVLKYIKSLSVNSQGMNQKITMLMQKTLRENILDYLKQQSIFQNSDTIILPISKKELADFLGVQRPSLFRELKKLKDEGIIEVNNHEIKLLKD